MASLKGETSDTLVTSGADAPDPSDAGEEGHTPSSDRLRNERGQFIKADGTVDADQRPNVEAPLTDVDPAKASDVQPSTAVGAPSSWSAEAKAEFSKLPPAVQQAAVKRESEMESGRRQWSEEKQTLLSFLDPVRQTATQYGQHPAEVVKKLAEANAYLERDPAGAIRWLASSYGVDISKISTEQPSAPQSQADPVVAQLSEKVSQFERMFQEQEQTRVADTLHSFASQPGHDHFEAVKADMGRLMLVAIQTGRADFTLQDAYDQAVWANPTTRTAMLASQNAGAVAAQKQREAADKARRGAISVNGAPGAPLAPARRDTGANSSVADDVKAAMEQLRTH